MVTGGRWCDFQPIHIQFLTQVGNTPTLGIVVVLIVPIINLSKKYIPTKFYFSVGSNTAQGNQTWYIQGSTNGSTGKHSVLPQGNVGGGFGAIVVGILQQV